MMSLGYPTNFFQVNEFSRKICGIWLPGPEYHIVLRLLHLIYVTIFYGIELFITIGEHIIVGEYVKKFSKLASHLGVLLTNFGGHVKLFILAFRYGRLKEMMNVLQDEEYQYVSLGESRPGDMLAKEQKVNSLISYLLLIMYTMSGISGDISTQINLNFGLKGNTFEHINKTCNDFLNFNYYIPFPNEHKWQCVLASIINDIGMAGQAFVHATHDALFAGLLNCLKTQLLIIGDVFKTIRQRSLKNLDLPEDYAVLHDVDNPDLEEEMYRQLTHSTKHLKVLLAIRDDMERMFTYVLLIQVLASLLIYASCLFVASTVSMTSPDFFAQMEFFFSVLLQLSFMCWFGNEISHASEQIKISLYESDWFSCSNRFKKSMIITMSRMQLPVYLSIGKFSPLTLVTLVCRGSFSYFALFKSVQ
ncbi:hypothetical protein JTB14_003919 [Gonioctena quinquepunctata]|nr:hypothetical protein JTB14_003919 [Gonioctena quinquepunctata]